MARAMDGAASKIQAGKRGGVANLTNAGKGRPKGAPNKATAQVKEMVIAALSKAGGVDYLVQQADKTPAAFLSLVGKVIPVQVAGHDGGAIMHRVEIVGVPAAQA